MAPPHPLHPGAEPQHQPGQAVVADAPGDQRGQHEQDDGVAGQAGGDHRHLERDRQDTQGEDGDETVPVEEALVGLVGVLHAHGVDEPGTDGLVKHHADAVAEQGRGEAARGGDRGDAPEALAVDGQQRNQHQFDGHRQDDGFQERKGGEQPEHVLGAVEPFEPASCAVGC